MRSQLRERGAAAVEFALIMPVLLALVLGVVEFGHAYSVQTQLSGAAREGVRSMALTNSSTTAKTTAKAAAPTLSITDSQIAVTLKAGTTTVTSCSVAATATTPDVTVTITYPMTFLTTFFGTSLTLKGKAVMRCNG